MEIRRLDENGPTAAHASDGKVRLTLWLEGRKPADDPLTIEMTPGDAMSLVSDLADAAKATMIRQLGGRSR